MIDMTTPFTVTTSGLEVLAQGDTPTQLFTFGKILLLRKDHCIVLVSAGEKAGKKIHLPLTFPATVDGVTYHVDRPDAVTTTPKAKQTRAKAAPGETKIAKCRAIFRRMNGHVVGGSSKAEIVAAFVAEAGCTPAGANTYYITLNKE